MVEAGANVTVDVGNASNLCFRERRDIICYFAGNREGINNPNCA